jgi:hypothetical protein
VLQVDQQIAGKDRGLDGFAALLEKLYQQLRKKKG